MKGLDQRVLELSSQVDEGGGKIIIPPGKLNFTNQAADRKHTKKLFQGFLSLFPRLLNYDTEDRDFVTFNLYPSF